MTFGLQVSRGRPASAHLGSGLLAERFDRVQNAIVRQRADARVQHEAIEAEGVANPGDLLRDRSGVPANSDPAGERSTSDWSGVIAPQPRSRPRPLIAAA